MSTSATPLEFVEIAPHEKGFSEYFKNKVAPLLEGLEQNRLLYVRQFKWRSFWGVLAIVVNFIFSLSVLSAWINGNSLTLALFVSLAISAWILAPLRQYEASVKNTYIPAICSFFGDFKYLPNAETNIETHYKGPLFPEFDSVETEDFIEGRLGKVRMVLHETDLKRLVGKSNKTIFKGLVINFEFPEAFNGRTLMKRDFGKIGNFLYKLGQFNMTGLERVHLEDPLFEQYFEVYSTDQVEARVHLTTAFMERLIRLVLLRSGNTQALDPNQPLSESSLRHGNVECLFDDRFLTLVLPSSQNLFEPGSVFTSVFKTDDLHVFLAQMQAIREILQILSIERRS